MNGLLHDWLSREWRAAREMLRGTGKSCVDWKTAVGRSQLPTEVQTLIARVVCGTHLRKREKSQVAEELIAHFQDGIAKGLTGGQLIADFGDPQLAARLIGNSKRRNRPMLDRIYRLAMWSSATGALGYLALTFYFYWGKPRPSVDFLPALNALSQCFITGIDEKINRRGIVKHQIFFHHQILAGMNLLLIPDFIKTTREIIKSFSGEHGEQQFIVRGGYHGKITVQHDLRIRPVRH